MHRFCVNIEYMGRWIFVDAITLLGIISAAAAAAGGLTVFLVAPGRSGSTLRKDFSGRYFAHRGLHTADKSIPENSLAAFEAAAHAGYGIELDVHILREGELVVFHDDNTKRVCGVDGVLEQTPLSELRMLKLHGTKYGIPTLREALEAVGSRSPIIIELKRGHSNRALCEKTYALMKEYDGTYCIESFDPTIVRWFKKNAPEILRGQLSVNVKQLSQGTARLAAFAVGNLLTNVIARPHFIAYGLGRKSLLVRLSEKLGGMKVVWVSRRPEEEGKSEAVIFEFYRPQARV